MSLDKYLDDFRIFWGGGELTPLNFCVGMSSNMRVIFWGIYSWYQRLWYCSRFVSECYWLTLYHNKSIVNVQSCVKSVKSLVLNFTGRSHLYFTLIKNNVGIGCQKFSSAWATSQLRNRAPLFKHLTRVCRFCLKDAYHIIFTPGGADLYKRDELFGFCKN